MALTAAFEGYAEGVLLAELDEAVASVWQTMLAGDADWLADRILGFRMTQEAVEEVLGQSGGSVRDAAFRTLLRNRVSHGGIMARGAGLIRHGESGKGISSRWYPQTLAQRVRSIGKVRDRIGFLFQDGIEVVRKYADKTDVVFFIDPPYTAAGKRAGTRLYACNELDHEKLFVQVASVCGDFLMTYDNAEDVRAMAYRHGFEVVEIAMKNTHHARMSELLIGRDLRWARDQACLPGRSSPG